MSPEGLFFLLSLLQMKKSSSLNIAINVPGSVARKAVKISEVFAGRGGLFALDMKEYHPHVTVYMAEFPLKNVPEAIARLRGVLSRIRRFRMKSAGYHQGATGYVDVGFTRVQEITRLQRAVVRALNPLREGLMRSADLKKLPTLRSAERKNIRRYGYRSVGRNYRPHLTFTRLRKRKWKTDALRDVPPKNFSFTAGALVLLRAGKHGTGREMIKRFRLAAR
jgi:2'-5' RNA ligase